MTSISIINGSGSISEAIKAAIKLMHASKETVATVDIYDPASEILYTITVRDDFGTYVQTLSMFSPALPQSN
jgi:hypothetical protein